MGGLLEGGWMDRWKDGSNTMDSACSQPGRDGRADGDEWTNGWLWLAGWLNGLIGGGFLHFVAHEDTLEIEVKRMTLQIARYYKSK
jgi:hypothetical protein